MAIQMPYSANMPIQIIDPPIIAHHCKTRTIPEADHRSSIYRSNARLILERVVKGNDVLEIGCGLFGGLSELVLCLGCNSYTGINLCSGYPKKTAPGTSFHYRIDYFRRVPLLINIPPEIADHPKVNFVFGIDFLTYLKESLGQRSNSLVTISTGFFHDFLLMPDNSGEDYVQEGMHEIARVTKPGKYVGFHHFLIDSYRDADKITAGRKLRAMFGKTCLEFKAAEFDCCRENMWYISKE